MKITVLCACLLSAAIVGVRAEIVFINDGNSLAEGLRLSSELLSGHHVTDAQRSSAFVTVGFLQGFFGACLNWQTFENAPFRIPKGVTVAQFIKIADKYVKDYPDRLHEKASALLFLAVVDAFPNPEYKR